MTDNSNDKRKPTTPARTSPTTPGYNPALHPVPADSGNSGDCGPTPAPADTSHTGSHTGGHTGGNSGGFDTGGSFGGDSGCG